MHPKYRANFISTNAEEPLNPKPLQLPHVNPAHHPHLAKNRLATALTSYAAQDIHIPGLDPAVPFHPMQRPESELQPPQEVPQPTAQYSEDLERLKRLKEMILAGQHPRYKPIPQPDALDSLYLGTARLSEPSGVTSDVSAGQSRSTDANSPPITVPPPTKSLLHRIGQIDQAASTPFESDHSRPASSRNSIGSRKLSNGFGSQPAKDTGLTAPATSSSVMIPDPEDTSRQPLPSAPTPKPNASSYVGPKRKVQGTGGKAAATSSQKSAKQEANGVFRQEESVKKVNKGERSNTQNQPSQQTTQAMRSDVGPKIDSRPIAINADTPASKLVTPSVTASTQSRPARLGTNPNVPLDRELVSIVSSRLPLSTDDERLPVIPMETSTVSAGADAPAASGKVKPSTKVESKATNESISTPLSQQAPRLMTARPSIEDNKRMGQSRHQSTSLSSPMTANLLVSDAAAKKIHHPLNVAKAKAQYPEAQGNSGQNVLLPSNDQNLATEISDEHITDKSIRPGSKTITAPPVQEDEKQSLQLSEPNHADRRRGSGPASAETRPVTRPRQQAHPPGMADFHHRQLIGRRELDNSNNDPTHRNTPGPVSSWPARDESRGRRSAPQVWNRERPSVDRRASPPRDMLAPRPDWAPREEWSYRLPRAESPPWEQGSYRPPRLLQRMSDFPGEDPDDLPYDPYISLSHEARYPRPRSPSPMHRPGPSSRLLEDMEDDRPSKRLRDDMEPNAFYPDERDHRAFPVPYDYPPRPGSPGYSGIGGTLPPHTLVGYRHRDVYDRSPVYEDEYRRYPIGR